MTNLEITKILALILLLKRRRKNSVVIKVDMVEKSKSFGLAPGTFRKYLNLCIEKGWIVQEKGNTYRCIKLRSIISQFCKETGLVVGYHDFLVKSKGYPKNFRPMHKVVLSALAADNVLAKQEYFREANDLIASDNKRQKSNKKKSRKNNNGPEGYKRVKSALKRLRQEMVSTSLPRAGVYKQTKSDLGVCVTSSRHLSASIGISRCMANNVLREENEFFSTKKHQYFVLGNPYYLYEFLSAEFPNAFIVPARSGRGVKVCFGREIIKKGDAFSKASELALNSDLFRFIRLHRTKVIKIANFGNKFYPFSPKTSSKGFSKPMDSEFSESLLAATQKKVG